MLYNWQQKDWPHFHYNLSEIESKFGAFVEKTAHMTGILSTVPPHTKVDIMIDLMVSEANKTSEIEGEYLSRKEVEWSIRKNLGLFSIAPGTQDKRVAGIAILMIDVRNGYKEDLTEQTLFNWHTMLLCNAHNFIIGNWRMHTEPHAGCFGRNGKRKNTFRGTAFRIGTARNAPVYCMV